MYLYKFTTTDHQNRKQIFFKFCRYPKKTKLYRACMKQLNQDKIKRFTYGNSI